MASPVIQVRVSREVADRLDAARGDRTRSDFVRPLIEAALNGGVNNPVPKIEINPVPEGEPVALAVKEDASALVEKAAGIRSNPKMGEAPRKNPYSFRDRDKVDLMALVRGKRLSSRQAKEALGWPGLRYENAERALLKDGKIWFVDGVIEVLE